MSHSTGDPMLERRESYFLIVGNGRTGSSWLVTNLDRLSDVTARHEIKWRDGQTVRPDAQYVVDGSSSIPEAISAAARDPLKLPNVRGSKLIFNPYSFHGRDVFAGLDAAIGENCKLVLLKRSYLDIWLSWKARGVYHEVDETVAPIDAANNTMLDAMRSMTKPETHDIVLHHGSGALSDHPGIAYPLETAIDDLLQLYANDLQAVVVCHRRNGLVIDYQNIGSDLHKVANFIGSHATAEEAALIAGLPQTIKLPSLSDRLHPAKPLADIASAMDGAFEQVSDRTMSPQSAFQWLNEYVISITAPDVVAAFSAAGFKPHGHEIIWNIKKPLVKAASV
jgi:hypothetical protein